MKHISGAKILTAALVVVMCLTFVVLFIYGLNSVLAMEGAFPPVVDRPGLTAAPQTAEELTVYLDRVLADARQKQPRLQVAGGFDVDEGSLELSGSDAVKQTALYAASGFEAALSAHSKTGEVGYGCDMGDLLTMPHIAASDILSFTCEYIYYACGSCGAENDVPQDSCRLCGYTYPYAQRYRDEYTITVQLAVTQSLLDGCFSARSGGEIGALYGSGFDGFFNVTAVTPEYKELTLTFRVNRLTDQITFLEYGKSMHITADVQFLNDFAALGSQSAAFELTEKENYTFIWPSLVLSAETMVLQPKGQDNLLATLTCDDPLGAAVKWRSSDESVVSVDGEGYLKAGKQPGTAIVTAAFEFQGTVYEDECTVYVRVPVESSAISRRRVTLSAGQEHLLSVQVSPRNATVQTVTWYSENEAVAAVDQNGCVQAVGPGATTVYALTDDGYYKSSCEVTVE